MKIGFIGLGIMGSAMARHLREGGYDVTVCNRTAEKTLPFKKLGCGVAKTPKELAAMTDVCIVMVTNPAAIDDVLEGKDGWLSGGVKGKLLINMSTVSVLYTNKLAALCKSQGIRFLDCPVSGSKVQVEAGQIVILAGGEKEEVDRATPIFLKMGRAVVYAGPVGSGSALKLCMNLIIAQMTSAVAESATLARALGIDPALIFETIHNYPAIDCPYFRIKEKNILSGNFAPAFSLANILKDVRFMLEEASSRGQQLPVTFAVKQLMEQSLADGNAEKDLSVITETLSKMKSGK